MLREWIRETNRKEKFKVSIIVYKLPGVDKDESEMMQENSQNAMAKNKNTGDATNKTPEKEKEYTYDETTDEEPSNTEATCISANDNSARMQSGKSPGRKINLSGEKTKYAEEEPGKQSKMKKRRKYI